MNARDAYNAASSETSYDDSDDWNSVFGEAQGSDYAAGPGYGESAPMNISAGGGGAEMKVNLGPLYSYQNGQKVYNEGDYAPGPQYTSPAQQNTPGTQKPAGYTISGDPWYDTGTGGGAQPYSAANYPKSNVSWATPYNKATTQSGIKTGGSGISTTKAAGQSVNISKTVLPKNVALPTFAGPTWDEKEIKKRSRRIAAPGLRALDMKLQQAMSRYYENPNVRRMVLRDTLQGYGIGVSNILAQATQAGSAQYAQDYSRQYSEAVNTFNRDWQKAMQSASQVSTSVPAENKQAIEDILSGKSGFTA